jgi:hypothetical protein
MRLPLVFVTFLSAFLIFIIEPMMGKYLLPWFGGGANIWNVVMLFYVSVLFLGYAYSTFLVKLPIKKQIVIHSILLILSLVILIAHFLLWKSPLFPPDSFRPVDSSKPIQKILYILSFSILFPFFILSTTSTLVQYIYGLTIKKKSAYSLYAVSNAASFLAVFLYPFLIEPRLKLSNQSIIWSIGFIFYFVLIGIILRKYLQYGKTATIVPFFLNKQVSFMSLVKPIIWITLSAFTNVLLFSLTAYVTQGVAPMPFVWLVPIALYLLSFIVAFSGIRWYEQIFHIPLGMVLIVVCLIIYTGLFSIGNIFDYVFFFITAFFIFLIVHTELFNIRPSIGRLPAFYLLTSLGGVIGAFISVYVFPYLFLDLLDYPFSLIIALVVFTAVLAFKSRKNLVFIQASALGVLLLVFSLSMIIYYVRLDRNIIFINRNFYGVVKIKDYIDEEKYPETERVLLNGTIKHGAQYIGSARRFEPTSYYQKESGIGELIGYYQKNNQKPLKLGVVGLGAGTLAAYCQKKDIVKFYEINPIVLNIADKYFSNIRYCTDQGGEVIFKEGDARLSMEQELDKGKTQKFDILAIDAFTDDSIPVHLLTLQAVQIYLKHLENDGYLAIHISNGYLDLALVLKTISEYLHLNSAIISKKSSEWFLMSTREIPIGESTAKISKIKLWTDDYSDLLSVLK